MVAVFFVWYNFCLVHQTLRMTPAMEAGWPDHIWTIQELLTVTVNRRLNMAKILLVILKDGNREIRIQGFDRVIADRATKEMVAYGEDGHVKERFKRSEVKSSRLASDDDPVAAGLTRQPDSPDQPSKGS